MSRHTFIIFVLSLSLGACLLMSGRGRVYAQEPTNNANAPEAGNKIYLPFAAESPVTQAPPTADATLATPAVQEGFSVSILSDPQLTWWRGGDDPLCNTETCEDDIAEETNRNTVNAVNRLNDPNFTLYWPITPTLAMDAGAPILPPVRTIINGDLTGFWHEEDAARFKGHYANFKSDVYPGLGNHDYENNVNDCSYSWIYEGDKNRCAKEAVWWMADQIEHKIPNLISKDLSGYVAVANYGGFDAVFTVKYWQNGEQIQKTSLHFAINTWQMIVIPRDATNIQVKIEANTGMLWEGDNGWVEVETYEQPGPFVRCHELSGPSWKPIAETRSCPREWADGSNGSLAYSYEIGNYHFVQLQNRPNYAVNLPIAYFTIESFFPYVGKTSPGFEVTQSYDWLRTDLQRATAAGKSIVINMHNAYDDSTYKVWEDTTFTNAIQGQNVVAIFAGHLHERYGQLKTMLDNGVYTIPIILSGSVECQTFLLAEFHRKYFNVGVVKSGSNSPDFVKHSQDLCDYRVDRNWMYNSNEGNTAPRTYFINRSPTVSAALETTPALEGADLAFRAVGLDPDGDPLTYSWHFGDGATSAEATPTHRYQDNGVYAVTVTVDDGYGGTASAGFSVQVDNVPPQITATAVTITEDGTAIVRGTISDPGVNDDFDIYVDWDEWKDANLRELGALLGPGAQTYTISHRYRDDDPTGTPADRYAIEIFITDKDNGGGVANSVVTVNNANPQTQISQILDQAGETVGEADISLSGLPVTVTIGYADVGTLDTRTAMVAWQDETALLDLGAVGTTTILTHTYTQPGVYTLAVTVTDDDTGVGATSRTFYVVPPTDAIRRAIAELEKVHSPIRDAETKIRAAIETLRGRDGASRPENVLDRLNASDWLNALELLEQTIHRLDLAEQVDTTLNFRRVKSLLTLAAKAIVVEAMAQASANATTAPEQLAAAQSIMNEGQALLNSGQYVPAIDKFSHALIRL
ncbi:MAG: PKD domain-containing protein [Caldilineaceae bacterium]